MHMADALLSPSVGGTMWAASAGLAAYSARKLKSEIETSKIPLMGVLGAFVFASQMINFTIPMTGSSGHLGGGMILAILLGPHAAFLVMFSILAVQALFFADGGLLALGCNVFNLGFWPCFVAYPLIFKRIVGENPTRGRILFGATVAGIVGLQLGAFGVVLETVFSGISELPFATFVLLMQPIHLAIGIVEGAVTAALVSFVWSARPEILARTDKAPTGSLKPVLIGLVIGIVMVGGVLSWFASARPDGLEWSMGKTSGREELDAPVDGAHGAMARLQEKTAFLPDYGFKEHEGDAGSSSEPQTEKPEPWPAVNAGTSVSGLLGGALVLAASCIIGLCLRGKQKAS